MIKIFSSQLFNIAKRRKIFFFVLLITIPTIIFSASETTITKNQIEKL